MDFNNVASLGARQSSDPLKIFDAMPKPAGINDLYDSQAHVLRLWYEKKPADAIVKLHTGGGKTLVGLLMCKSVMIETGLPVVYLCPDNQLTHQTYRKALAYGIEAVEYPEVGFPTDFMNAEAILVANYSTLFNGQTRFGLPGSGKAVQRLGGIVVDDAHAAFSDLRDAYTYRIDAKSKPNLFKNLAFLFKQDLEEIGRRGMFDEIVGGTSSSIIEIPYWAWRSREDAVRQLLGTVRAKDPETGKLIDAEHFFKWPFLMDQLPVCHALLSANGFIMTPLLPMVSRVPSYADCKTRVFMSATVRDNSMLVRTFDLRKGYLDVSSPGATGIAERFVLAPAFTPHFGESYEATTKKLTKFVASGRGMGAIVLAPSSRGAGNWAGVAEFVKGDEVAKVVDTLNDRNTNGPFVFANRYDGLDLPGDACRLVVMWELPQGMSDYELFRAAMLYGGDELSASLARTIEQGMGRGARGASDYCIVLFAGRSLEKWISLKSNAKHFSLATQIQIDIGKQVSRGLTSFDKIQAAFDQVLQRDRRWTALHASTLSKGLEAASEEQTNDEPAFAERSAFQDFQGRNFERARRGYEALASGTADKLLKSWFLQIAARAALYSGDKATSEKLQLDAHSVCDRTPQPPQARKYFVILAPDSQSQSVAKIVLDHDPASSVLIDFADDIADLHAGATSDQFEEALQRLGWYLGFNSQRPEKTSGVGPDVLWLAKEMAFVLEAKSRKLPKNKIGKSDAGQLLTSATWFEEHYPGQPYIYAVVAPTASKEGSFEAGTCEALTMGRLMQLIGDLKGVFEQLADAVDAKLDAATHAATLLNATSLTAKRLGPGYFVPLKNAAM